MTFNLSFAVVSFLFIVSRTSAASSDSFDNFVLSYGDFERCTFGIARSCPRKNKKSEATTSPSPKKNECEQSMDIVSSEEDNTVVNENNNKVGMVSHAVVAAEQQGQTIVHALRDEVDVLLNDDGNDEVQQIQVQTVSSTSTSTSTSSPSSLASIISIGRSRRSLKSTTVGDDNDNVNDSDNHNHNHNVRPRLNNRSRNQFGWGLHQSSGF